MSKHWLIEQLHKVGAVQFGEFTLKSGIVSPIYIDLRRIIAYPDLLRETGTALYEQITVRPDLICGVPYTALPIATAIALDQNIPMVMRRKEKKEHGTKQKLEGVFQPGQTCLVIEDLVTSGGSVLETITDLQIAHLNVEQVCIVIDREQGGKENLLREGIELRALMTLSEILDHLLQADAIPASTHEEVTAFITANQAATV